MSRKLNEEDFKWAADELGVEIATIKAVSEVEAPKGGFLPDGRPTILFERHKFSKYSGGKFDKAHPDISNKKRGGYIGGAGEWKRMDKAITLDKEAAYMSASFGKYQIMGFNHAACGFGNVFDFVAAMKESEGAQLKAFVALIKDWRLDDELRNHKWVAFAQAYNGAAYADNHYDTKLAAAYKKYKGQALLGVAATNDDIQQPEHTTSPLPAEVPPLPEETTAPATQQVADGGTATQVVVQPNAAEPAPVVKSALDSVAQIASTGMGKIGQKITWGTLLTGFASAVWGALQTQYVGIIIGFVFAIFLIGAGVTVFVVAYNWGQKKKIAEAQIRSDPARFNVSFEK